MSDSSNTKPKLNKSIIYVFICISLFILFHFKENFYPLISHWINFLLTLISIVLACLSLGMFPIYSGSTEWHKILIPFFLILLILWFNKYISTKIKQLFGFDIKGGNLIETRTIENPGIYNVFSDMVTGIGNGFIYIVTLQFLYPNPEDA